MSFEKEVKERIDANTKNDGLRSSAHQFIKDSLEPRYSYNFSWLGRPIIQYPQDMIAMQELIWEVKPDLIIETGIAHGGSLIFSASMLELVFACAGIEGEVLGVDIDIRPHNRKAIEEHPMYKRISLLQGSSIDPAIVSQVVEKAKGKKRILICLDSNHTHNHVLAELNAYAPLTTVGSYCVVFDTVVEDMPAELSGERPWGPGDNPKTAVWEYLKIHPEFEIDKSIQNKLLITVAPDGYLKENRLIRMFSEQCTPSVSIGIPVFNGAVHLESALDSLLGQTFSDFEIIISDNASSDRTKEICEKFAKNDERIRYIRQAENIGAARNFKFVLEQAVGEYFMWAAADDRRSTDFIALNYQFLSENSEYVASTSPNGFEGDSVDKTKFISFSLDDDHDFERIMKFFDYGWISHGIFYSLARTNILRSCEVIGLSFIAADWAVDIYLASKGKINRTRGGYTIFGVNGVSNSANAFKDFRNEFIELFIPFFQLSKYVLSLSAGFNTREKIKIMAALVKINIRAEFHQVWVWPYSIYFRYVRPIVHKKRLQERT